MNTIVDPLYRAMLRARIRDATVTHDWHPVAEMMIEWMRMRRIPAKPNASRRWRSLIASLDGPKR